MPPPASARVWKVERELTASLADDLRCGFRPRSPPSSHSRIAHESTTVVTAGARPRAGARVRAPRSDDGPRIAPPGPRSVVRARPGPAFFGHEHHRIARSEPESVADRLRNDDLPLRPDLRRHTAKGNYPGGRLTSPETSRQARSRLGYPRFVRRPTGVVRAEASGNLGSRLVGRGDSGYHRGSGPSGLAWVAGEEARQGWVPRTTLPEN